MIMGNTRKTRIHYVPDCEDTTGNDDLALTVYQAITEVNCSTCIHEMYEMGMFGQGKN